MNNAMSLLCNPSVYQLNPKISGVLPRNTLHKTYTRLQIRCATGTPEAAIINEQEQERLSDIYKPTIWDYTFLQSIKNYNADEIYKDRAHTLEEEFRFFLNKKNRDLLSSLELIDHIQRLGVASRFKIDIHRILDKLYATGGSSPEGKSLYAVALSFRIFRQNGFRVSQDVFKGFVDQQGVFLPSLASDVNGILNLYEASFLSFEGEDLLDEAKEYATKSLQNLQNISNSESISHALELPIRRRMDMLEARWYIDAYGKRPDANLTLVELAKINYNMIQSVLQRDLKDASRWWSELGLANKLPFSRDRLMECFFWAIGMFCEPPFSSCRKGLTKVTALVLTIDDVYDIYGTIEELELFTDAVVRWDVEAVRDLPVYMRLCFLALFNTVNDLAYETLKEQGGENVIPYLKNAWVALCKAFLQEAKWNYNKTTPSFQGYFENGWRSASGTAMLTHAYFLMGQSISHPALDYLKDYQTLLRWPSSIFRLTNDLSTSSAELARGETTNSIATYMNETKLSEEDARSHLSKLIERDWKKINKAHFEDNLFEQPFLEAAANLAKTAQCIYLHGDGFGHPDSKSKDDVTSLVVHPIPIA